MVTLICLINTLIALMLLYVAWRVRQLRLRLARLADELSVYERSIHAALYEAPNDISTGRLAIHQLRKNPQALLNLELLRVQQALTLLGVGQQIWRRFVLVRKRVGGSTLT